MGKNDTVAGVKHFLWDIVRFEKKKLILPCLAVLVILAAVFMGHHLRSQGLDEDSTQASLDTMTDLTVIFIEHSQYNDSIEKTSRERGDEIERRANAQLPYKEPNKSTMVRAEGAITGASLLAIYGTPFFPVAPGGASLTSGLGVRISEKSLIFSSEKGYYISEHVPESLTLVYYRQGALTDLAERANRTNMTLQEFRQEVEDIKSRGPQNSKLDQMGDTNPENSTFSEEELQMMRQTTSGEIKEIGLRHFVPAIFAAFIWNYLLGAFIIATFRSIRNFVSRLSNDSKNDRKQVNQQKVQGNRQYNNQQGQSRGNNLQNNRRMNNE